jgi:hypothetical protein
VTEPDDKQAQQRESEQVPEGYLSVVDLPVQILLRDPTSPISALKPEQQHKLLAELELALAYARRRGRVMSFNSPSGPLVMLGLDAQGWAWKGFIEGTLPVAIVLDDGRIENVSPSVLQLNVEDNVFASGWLTWPVERPLVVAEQDLERRMASAANPAPSPEPGTATTNASPGIDESDSKTPGWVPENAPVDAFQVVKNPRGRRGEAAVRVANEMKRQVKDLEITLADFKGLSEPKLATRFGASRTLVVAARTKALADLEAEALQLAKQKANKKQNKNK